MPTLPEVEQHKRAVADLATLALRDVRTVWGGLALDNPRQAAAQLREATPDLAATYALASSTLAADWYDDLRAEAAVAAFTATTLEPPAPEDVQSELGYVLAPLFAATVAPEAAPTETFNHLAALIEDVVTTSDRQTVRANVAVDQAKPRYARHASANACTFCAFLATRGADYTSEESALRVTLESRRQKRQAGEKYHDNCRCIAVPVWDSTTYEEAPYVSKWRAAYGDATADLKVTTGQQKLILSRMRESLGLRH